MSIVSLDNVVVKFDSFVAVNGISLRVQPGEVVGVLGGNGAGKSTTMKVIAGVLKETSGDVIIDGLTTKSVNESERIKELTGYCPDVGGLIVGATPREHIQLLLNMHGRPEDYPLALKALQAVGLGDKIDSPAGGFSHGESRRLSVLLASLSSQKVLILDEPFDGVDPLGAEAIKSIIAFAKQRGIAVLVSTHLQSLLVEVSDRIIIMRKGNILKEAEADYFRGEEGVRRYADIMRAAAADASEVVYA